MTVAFARLLLWSPRVLGILVVSGPLLLVGVLFLWSWRHHTQAHALG
jgi:hypothetical protein